MRKYGSPNCNIIIVIHPKEAHDKGRPKEMSTWTLFRHTVVDTNLRVTIIPTCRGVKIG